MDDLSIYTVDYSWFFDQITKRIKKNVKVPEFVDGMTADFGTTTAVQKIVSQITLLYSVKQYFRFDMMTSCGIPAVEMIGTEEDWNKLTSKLKVLRTLLEPIENDLGLNRNGGIWCKKCSTNYWKLTRGGPMKNGGVIFWTMKNRMAQAILLN